MSYSYGSMGHGESKKRQRVVRVLRYKRDEEPRLSWGDAALTEQPVELKQEPAGFLLVLQEAFNLLLLLTLALVLIILVVAFAYQWLVAPQALVVAYENLVNGMVSFFQSLVTALLLR